MRLILLSGPISDEKLPEQKNERYRLLKKIDDQELEMIQRRLARKREFKKNRRTVVPPPPIEVESTGYCSCCKIC